MAAARARILLRYPNDPSSYGVGIAVGVTHHTVQRDDIGALCRATGFFSDAEVAIAEELAADRRARGPTSDYRFVLADGARGLSGYACNGAIPGRLSGWDFY